MFDEIFWECLDKNFVFNLLRVWSREDFEVVRPVIDNARKFRRIVEFTFNEALTRVNIFPHISSSVFIELGVELRALFLVVFAVRNQPILI